MSDETALAAPDPGDDLPARDVLGQKHADRALIASYNQGLSLTQIAEKHGLGNPRKAARELDRALRKLEARMRGNAEIMRIDELLRLNRMTAALEDKMKDPKAAAELRLQSESRRRLFGVDLQREHEQVVPEIHVNFAVPPPPSFDVEAETDPPLELEGGEDQAADSSESTSP